MASGDKKQPQLTRRALILGGAAIGVGSILLGRLYQLQFLQGERYVTLAEGNRIKLHLTPPLRGNLLDRNGVVLATNKQNYRMLLRADQSIDLKQTMNAIHALTPIDPDTIKQVLSSRKPGRYAPPLLLKEFLTWEEVAKIEFNTAAIPGAVIEIGQVRYYPFGPAMAHVLGYVGTVSENDMDDHDLLKLPDFKVGKDGIEKILEQQLRGVPGVKEVEVNVHGLAVRELNTRLSTPGKETPLTIDSRLQKYTFDRLEGESAACVVLDVNTGDVLTLMSTPAFDPNQFSKGISSKYWKELNENKKIPLMNKAAAGQYPPGSTFKMVVGLAALEKGVVSLNERIFCPGYFMLGKHRFNCWKEGGHGSMNYHDALMHSCDTFFYTVAYRQGIENIAEMANRFGLGQKYDLPITTEKSGLIPTSQWKRDRYKMPWQAGDTVNSGIGQGYVLTTPLQLSVMAARLATGREVMPRLVLPDNPGPPAEFPKLDINPAFLQTAQKGMQAVVNEPGGTAYGRRIMRADFAMAGKTGTSQVRKILQRGQDQNSIPWEYRHHAWFVAYAPIERPRFAAALIVEHGGSGSGAAAPYVRDILFEAQKYAAIDSGTWTELGPEQSEGMISEPPVTPSPDARIYTHPSTAAKPSSTKTLKR